MATAGQKPPATAVEPLERHSENVGRRRGPCAFAVSFEPVHAKRWMLLILIQEAEPLQERLAIRRRETLVGECLKKRRGEIESAIAVRHRCAVTGPSCRAWPVETQ